MTKAYVCTFRGRRDSYQAPLALYEGGMLDQFITDAYEYPWMRTIARCAPQRVREKIGNRHEPGLPPGIVRCIWPTTLLEHARHGLGFSTKLTYLRLDRHFSLAAAKRATERRSHLFLYSPYAWEAFVAKYPHTPHKVLFQYHPHPAMEDRILAEDSAEYPDVGESYSAAPGLIFPENLLRRERDCWMHADEILCASTITKVSLLNAGADEKRCKIVPYGIDVPNAFKDLSPADQFTCVFVGAGGQRKGLHHLLLAWQRARLPPTSTLTLVCRMIDEGIERIASKTPRVRLIRGISQDGLVDLYASSSLFVMPSLLEGFGQVYLEALAQGCPVLGTANTCLPDLGTEEDGVFLVTPRDVDGLTHQLENLSAYLPGNATIRRAARACSTRFTWSEFRRGIRHAMNDG